MVPRVSRGLPINLLGKLPLSKRQVVSLKNSLYREYLSKSYFFLKNLCECCLYNSLPQVSSSFSGSTLWLKFPKMRFLGKLLSMATFIYCPQCIKYLDIQNQALYNEIVDHFFPKELGHPGIDIRRNLYKYSFNGKCCRCTKTCRYYGTCCIDAFFNNNITSVEEYIDIFFNMTKIRKHIETLPIVNIADTSVKFRVEKLPMVASCGNKGSVYASLCNASDPGDETRVIADGFVYKNKHCA